MPSHKCHQCLKTFPRADVFREHVRTHTGEKPNQCEDCGIAFAHRGDLWQHRKIHGERKHVCYATHQDGTQCHADFHRWRDLVRHQKTCRALLSEQSFLPTNHDVQPMMPAILPKAGIVDTATWMPDSDLGAHDMPFGRDPQAKRNTLLDRVTLSGNFEASSTYTYAQDNTLTVDLSPDWTMAAYPDPRSSRSIPCQSHGYLVSEDAIGLGDDEIQESGLASTGRSHLANELVNISRPNIVSAQTSSLTLRSKRFNNAGCRNCVQRHVNCELGRPSCKRCDKRRLMCLGYGSGPQHREVVPTARSSASRGSTGVLASDIGVKGVLALLNRWTMNSPSESNLLDHRLDINWDKCFWRLSCALWLQYSKSYRSSVPDQAIANLTLSLIPVVRVQSSRSIEIVIISALLLALCSVCGGLSGAAEHMKAAEALRSVKNDPRPSYFEVDTVDVVDAHRALLSTLHETLLELHDFGRLLQTNDAEYSGPQARRVCSHFLAYSGILRTLFQWYRCTYSTEGTTSHQAVELYNTYAFLAEVEENLTRVFRVVVRNGIDCARPWDPADMAVLDEGIATLQPLLDKFEAILPGIEALVQRTAARRT